MKKPRERRTTWELLCNGMRLQRGAVIREAGRQSEAETETTTETTTEREGERPVATESDLGAMREADIMREEEPHREDSPDLQAALADMIAAPTNTSASTPVATLSLLSTARKLVKKLFALTAPETISNLFVPSLPAMSAATIAATRAKGGQVVSTPASQLHLANHKASEAAQGAEEGRKAEKRARSDRRAPTTCVPSILKLHSTPE